MKNLSLLKTKLFVPPPRSNWIKRRHLLKRMDEGFVRKFTLISAPAGFGKTTLLVDWVLSQKKPVAWFSVDKGDSDPLQFLTYVILGLQTLESAIGKSALTILQSPQPQPIEAILVNLINDLVRIQYDMALVLDDYHLVNTRQIHDLIEFLLENMPERMHLIMATREDPPLDPLARLRSQDQLLELRAADLSFSVEEIQSFFNKSLELHLTTNDIHLLETRTEGWIAGLQLVALSLRGREDPSSFLRQFKGDNRYIADYLTGEVLSRQPQQIRNFLTQTSILKHLSAPLCNAVTQQENSEQILLTLERANLFIVPLDDESCWYRYHQLFADLLQQRLHHNQKKLVTELHNRACQWHMKHGDKTEAVDHAFSAQNYVLAGQLIEEIAETDWDRSQESLLLFWLRKLPIEQLEDNPRLCIYYARELFKNGDLDNSEQKLQIAEQVLESSSIGASQKKELHGRIAVIRAYISSRTGNVPRIIQFSNRALELLPEKDAMWRGVAATTLGFAYSWIGSGDLPKAQQAFSEAQRICQAGGNIYFNIFVRGCLGSILMMRGRMKQAKDVCELSLSLAKENGLLQTGIVGGLYSTLGMILCEWNDLEEGVHLIKRGVELSERGQDPVSVASCRINLVRASIYRGDFTTVSVEMENLNKSLISFRLPPWITNTIAAFNAFGFLHSGNFNAAMQWVAERKLSPDGELSNLHELEYIALAHALIAQNKLHEADRLFGRLLEHAEAGDRVYIMIELWLGRMLLYMAMQDDDAALGAMKTALALAEPGGLIMIFASKGKPVTDFLEKIVATKNQFSKDMEAVFSLSFARKILSVCKSVKPENAGDFLDPLSRRELEVLNLIAAGLSNKEISERLFISLNTVKTHTKNINSKLNANNRTRAIARAKELGFL